MGSEPLVLPPCAACNGYGKFMFAKRCDDCDGTGTMTLYAYALALQRRAEEAERAAAEAKSMHARILAWPPQDVANADARISMAAAMIAKRDGPSGAALLAALDTLKRHRRQQDAEIDRLRAEGGRDA